MRIFQWLLLFCLWVGCSQSALAVYGFEEKIQPIATVALDEGKPIQLGYIYCQSHFFYLPLYQARGRLVAFSGDKYLELEPNDLKLVEEKLGGKLQRRVPFWLRIRLLNWWVPGLLFLILASAYRRRKRVLDGTVIPAESFDLSNIFRPDRYVNSPKNLKAFPAPAFVVRSWGAGLICLFFWLLCLAGFLCSDAKIHGLAWLGLWLFGAITLRYFWAITAFRFDETMVHFHGRCMGLSESWSEPYENFVGLTVLELAAGKDTIYQVKLKHRDPQKSLVMVQKHNSSVGMAEEQCRLHSIMKVTAY